MPQLTPDPFTVAMPENHAMRTARPRYNRRTWLQVTGAGLAAGALSGCEGRSASSKRVLKVFNWSLYIDDKVIPEFEQQAGCRVVYDNYSSDSELEARLATGGGAYDVVFPSDRAMQALLAKQLLQPLDQA
ncbi:MAG TPA: hypothetical protein VFV87_11510, partial [Pirellulaceae bacterium]|nr:hypothetical protein [Pirellulaceae bacterium]